MARPTKTGLDYFPLDVDFHDDDKVGLLISEFGICGESILTRLLCKIYKNGYYYSWGDDECLLFCRWAGGIFVPNQVSEVVAGCIRRSIFDKRVFDAFGVLTSRGIQRRFLQAVKERKSVEIIADFWLLDVPKTGQFRVNPPDNSINPPDNRVNRPESTQSIGKYSKVKERKVNISIEIPRDEREDRNRIFEIFFFRNFINPAAEVERFISHYAATGWMRGSQLIVDRVTLANNWTPEEKGRGRFPPEFLATWRLFYEDQKETDPAGAMILLRDMIAAKVTEDRLILHTESRALPDYIGSENKSLSLILSESLPGRRIRFYPKTN